ncbi:acetyltransferase domain protein [Burkholderia gladioli]|uniref:Acetyltransferase domain protein n=1 Tax=Burkholderia gladioli TaxID=28095 RepID=A0AAW3FA56_BURGA|nr:GNAT family N-acetyltransferase [Burkholderia gladioli]AJW98590.1 acetyltransferase domain protein [Burkholderia gladioli]ASD81105.1 N-acetyltransferase [Burkholderia gladioli pv. gladioli]AWY53663.1 N-acetyltransferase [Burkholderia gladioli pv. gladioli]KGC17196.1 acetyltransferase domain protein [Burkholderia gladioli]PRG98311.1 N-acetyltransferase [Burkholderia gladioli]
MSGAPAVAIRAARPADAPAVSALLRQLGYEAGPAQVQGRLEALAGSAADTVLVAAVGSEIAGCISLHALPLFHAEGRLGRITSLVVDQGRRSRGIGGALMAAAAAWFEAAGCVKTEVTSGDHRADAHRFYARHGYARDGQRLSRRGPFDLVATEPRA